MTPEQARQLLDGTSPDPWRVEAQTYQEAGCPEVTDFWITDRYDFQVAEQNVTKRHHEKTESDFNLIAAAPDMAAMIANMTTEYAIEYQSPSDSQWHRVSAWYPLIDGEELNPRERIVKRYVTAPQPLGGEEQ